MMKIIPITAYDFDFLKSFVKNNYGNDISSASFNINVQNPENPRCGNCDAIVRGAYANLHVRPRYCVNCGAEMIWPNNYRGCV